MENLGKKFLQTVIGEVVGAVFFVIIIIFVAAFREAMPQYPLSVSNIVLLWGLYGILTPIVIFTDIIGAIQDMIHNRR